MTSFYEKSFAIGVCEKKLSFLVAPPNVFSGLNGTRILRVLS
jgi:hypothetical protein